MPTAVENVAVVHKSSSGVSMVFPDVCAWPGAGAPLGVPIPYPNVATIATQQRLQWKGAVPGASAATKVAPLATKTPPGSTAIPGQTMALRQELASLHAQVANLPKGNPDAWQRLLEKYLATASALYVTLMSG
jgi:hypothetical protein